MVNDTAPSQQALGPDAAAVAALLDESRPLYLHPGPALLLDRDIQIIAANPAALGIARGLLTGMAPKVMALSRVALDTGDRPHGLRVGDDDTGTTTDLVLLPLDDGAHLLVIGRDVSLDSNLRTTLVESRQRYKDLLEISSDFAWETDENGAFSFVSPGGALGYRPDQLIGRLAADFVDLPAGVDIDLPFAAEDTVQDAEFRFHRAGGGVADLIASALPLRDDDGAWRGARGICRDVSEERARDAALARAQGRERLMAYIARTIRDEIEPTAVLSAAVAAISRALSVDGCQILRTDSRGGFRVACTFGTPPADPLLALDPAMENPVLETGESFHAAAQTTNHRRSVNGAVVVWRDGTEASWRKEEIALLGEAAGLIGVAMHQITAHEHLEQLSTTDPLTGLLNRRTFTERLRARVDAKISGDSVPGVLAYVDLDNFKLVNDQMGHQAGDRALVAIASALRASVRQDDLIARLGGDEFALWLDGVDLGLAETRAQDLISDTDLIAPYVIDSRRPFGMSIGLAEFDPASGESLEELVARADLAMYRIKHGDKNGLAVAPPAAIARGDVNA